VRGNGFSRGVKPCSRASPICWLYHPGSNRLPALWNGRSSWRTPLLGRVGRLLGLPSGARVVVCRASVWRSRTALFGGATSGVIVVRSRHNVHRGAIVSCGFGHRALRSIGIRVSRSELPRRRLPLRRWRSRVRPHRRPTVRQRLRSPSDRIRECSPRTGLLSLFGAGRRSVTASRVSCCWFRQR
jgi:hypothetical protein